MSEEDEKILNNLINKKDEVLEFEEIKSIVKLLLEVNKKIDKLLSTELKVEIVPPSTLMNLKNVKIWKEKENGSKWEFTKFN